MKIPGRLIEQKLSQLLGAEVTFDRLDVSFAGKLEAEGMTVAGDGQPLARVRRITAQVGLAQLLAGKIVVKSVEVEEPQVFFVWRGGSFKCPRPLSQPDNSPKENSWKFEAQSVQITNGRIEFQIPRSGSVYQVSAQRINGELTQTTDKIAGELSIGSVNRTDVPMELGSIKLLGEVAGTGTFFNRPIAMKLQVTDIAKWQTIMPPALSQLKFTGSAEVNIRMEIDPATGIQIHEINLGTANINVPLSGVFSPRTP